ncbi:MAG: hypothetical protein ACXWAY_01345 [Acidimicrobiia bacterium]
MATNGTRPKRGHATAFSTLLRYCVAGLLVGAAGIHFAMMGEHAGVSWTHGLFFAGVAWVQVVLAGAILLRPSRHVVLAVIVVNAAIIGVWILTRTVGIAIGSDGTPEAWGTVDIVCATFEGLAILASGLLLARRFAGRPVSAEVGGAMAAFIGLAVVAVTTFVFSPAFASSGGGVSGVSADGHHHGGTAAGVVGHTHTTVVDDKGLSLLHNGHHAHIGAEQPLSPADRVTLTAQMQATIEVARRLPTPKEAVAAGYRQTGPYMPGIGAHFIKIGGASLNPTGVMSAEALATPLAIIYDGISPDSRIAGFMYYSMSKEAPAGFAGPNDHWHFHTSLCLKYGPNGIDLPLGFDVKIPVQQCTAIGGTLLKQSQWMVHVWSVPGWESSQGLFGEVNPALACPDGTYYQRPMREWIAHPANACKSAA